MKLTEKQLTNIIEESVKKNLMEYRLKQYIKNIVRESFESMGGFSQFEEEEDNNKSDKKSAPKPIHNPNGVSDMNNETKEEEERRSQVEEFFKKEGVDIAPYAYQLYNVERTEGEDTNEMKNARSKFMKCLNHEPNEDGYPYSFDSAEINKLHSFISAGQLSEAKINEAVRKAIKKVLG